MQSLVLHIAPYKVQFEPRVVSDIDTIDSATHGEHDCALRTYVPSESSDHNYHQQLVMPHIHVRNETKHVLHAGFNILGMKHPTRHYNALQPGMSFDAGDFPSFVPQSFEVRSDVGPGFHDGETWEHGTKLAAAGVVGSAAVASGIVGVMTRSPVAMTAAGVLGQSASAGKFLDIPALTEVLAAHVACSVGKSYGEESVYNILKRVSIWVSWGNMELVIRDSPEGGQGVEVWSGGSQL